MHILGFLTLIGDKIRTIINYKKNSNILAQINLFTQREQDLTSILIIGQQRLA